MAEGVQWRLESVEGCGTVSLARGEVQVWMCRCADAGAAALEGLERTLSAPERAQAERFVRPADRMEHVVSHGVLRALAAAYLGVPAREVRFVRGGQGKPGFAGEQNPCGVAFNLSHSRGLALLAFTVGEVVGVDVERHRGVRDRDALVRRFFHRREARLLLRLRPEAREGAFFRCWTRKEAVLKAAGLSVALHSGSVALLSRRTLRELWPRQPAVRLAHGLLPGGLRLHWTDLPVGEGCSGAVAYSGPRAAVSLRLFGFGDRGECRDSGAVDTFG